MYGWKLFTIVSCQSLRIPKARMTADVLLRIRLVLGSSAKRFTSPEMETVGVEVLEGTVPCLVREMVMIIMKFMNKDIPVQ